MDAQAAWALNPLQLAYVGDTVHDLFVRTHLLGLGYAVGGLHKRAVTLVCAAAQARWAQYVAPLLTDRERELIRRGRNAHPHHSVPKRADPADYQLATGLEALWGYLYLVGEHERLAQLLRAGLRAMETETRAKGEG
jgi:ribonuclease-3 family protein